MTKTVELIDTDAEFRSLPPGDAISVRVPPVPRGAFWLVPRQTTFTFRVKSCRSAVLSLARFPFNASEHAMTIVIGAVNNTRVRTRP